MSAAVMVPGGKPRASSSVCSCLSSQRSIFFGCVVVAVVVVMIVVIVLYARHEAGSGEWCAAPLMGRGCQEQINCTGDRGATYVWVYHRLSA